MHDYLKTKCCSLAEEAKIIRRLERSRLKKAKKARLLNKDSSSQYHYSVFNGLKNHRINDVRIEARHANLAYGFLKGKSYKQVELKAQRPPNWKRIQTLVEKYGEGDIVKSFEDWKNKAILTFETKQ